MTNDVDVSYYLLPLENGTVANGVSYGGALPAAAVTCTKAQYDDAGAWTVQKGAIVAYTPPAIPLATQATTALAAARTYIYNNYGILNEATPDAWVTYLKALMAIAGGTDTTSTALPTAPAS